MTTLRVLLLLVLLATRVGGAPVPAAGPASVFAGGLAGPEGLAFLNDGTLAVGSTTGLITRLAADGSASTLAETGESLAGLTTLRDGRLLAAAFGAGRMGGGEVYATGTTLADGIAFDRRGNLLVVGQDTLWVVDHVTRATTVLSTDPLFEGPSNLAFGRGRGFDKTSLFLANFGPALGDGTNVLRVPYTLRGAKLSR